MATSSPTTTSSPAPARWQSRCPTARAFGRHCRDGPRADIALLKIDQGGLTALPLADLDDVSIGQDVIAIGYALDLGRGEGPSFSVTRGIVSQKNRAINEGSQSSARCRLTPPSTTATAAVRLSPSSAKSSV
jgi:hypothetical protein